jgi:p-aminobenzoyl-glutamate transporter AbgT
MSSRKRRGKGKGFDWWTDWSALSLIAGFGVAYLAFVPLANHPLHWLLSFAGAVAGYVTSLLVNQAARVRINQLRKP